MSVTKSKTENKVIYSMGEEILLEASFEKKEQTKLIIKGAIKTLVAPCFDEVINEALERNEEILLDFSNVTYIASAGLRVLLNMQQIIDENDRPGIIIENVSASVMEVFEATGFNNILNIRK